MRAIALVILAAVTAFAADDAWTKVRDLKSGTELRIFKKGGMHPIIATMEEAHPDSLIIVVKNAEMAIPRELIDRIDYRPAKTSRVTRETSEKTVPPDAAAATESPNGAPSESTSTTTSYVFGAQPDYQTIYRRPPPEPKK